MKIETRAIVETVYVAEDGTEQADKHECEKYEWEQKAPKVYLVGSANTIVMSSIKVFSTYEEALQEQNRRYGSEIREVFVDYPAKFEQEVHNEK